MGIYFIADTHFSQERTLHKSKRPFANTKEMDLIMMMNWNMKVKPEDTVYVLGDVGYMDILPLLNGKKILIKGNYERKLPELLEGHEQEFAEIHDLVYNLKIEHENKIYNVFLAHEPMLVKDKVLDENTVVCFGHIHKLCMIKSYGLCVSADAHNFTPISFEDVLYYHNCILNYYDENVFY